MKKHLYIGKSNSGKVFVSVELKDSEKGKMLSISGVVAPRLNGDALGCGQIVNELTEITEYAEGWTAADVLKLGTIWEKWNLNDLHAGTPLQRETIRKFQSADNPSYDEQVKILSANGILIDNGYLYGSQWLYESLPNEVLDWFSALPNNGDKLLPEIWK